MDYYFDQSVVNNYKSKSQQIRIMSEEWVERNVYCPICGNPHLENLKNNMPVADFQCDYCGGIFELKSKRGSLGRKIVDGAYATMIERISSLDNPDLFVMQYDEELRVHNLVVIPKFFFIPQYIEKRNPLAPTARRAGWVGCNILYADIPLQGRIPIIQEQIVCDSKAVVAEYTRVSRLQTENISKRGWLLDVLQCVNSIKNDDFTLQEVYCYAELLQSKHMDNHNIEAKIRQQLQILRNKGFVEFLGGGRYKKLY